MRVPPRWGLGCPGRALRALPGPRGDRRGDTGLGEPRESRGFPEREPRDRRAPEGQSGEPQRGGPLGLPGPRRGVLGLEGRHGRERGSGLLGPALAAPSISPGAPPGWFQFPQHCQDEPRHSQAFPIMVEFASPPPHGPSCSQFLPFSCSVFPVLPVAPGIVPVTPSMSPVAPSCSLSMPA